MKREIKFGDIREGDLVRWESSKGENAAEWRVGAREKDVYPLSGTYYLLDRPRPKLEPRWGMMIQNPDNPGQSMIFLPHSHNDNKPWARSAEHLFLHCTGSTEAADLLAGGWEIVFEGVN